MRKTERGAAVSKTSRSNAAIHLRHGSALRDSHVGLSAASPKAAHTRAPPILDPPFDPPAYRIAINFP